MILCITPNPAIDRTILLRQLIPGEVQRAERLIAAAGGKGLNVARTIRRLDGEPLCMGFVGGHSGHLLADLAQNEGLRAYWTWADVETRTCTILVPKDGDATVINEPGMPISRSDWKRLISDVRQQVAHASLVCISGSLPPGSVENFPALLKMLVERRKIVWLDTSGAALRAALRKPGICIKVNGTEIGEALGWEVKGVPSARSALVRLLEQGFVSAVVTLGAAGALLATGQGRWQAQGPLVEVVSTVGSGDAFLGGLVSALDSGKDWGEALGDAVAAGTANALSAGGGQFTLQQFREIREQVRVQAW